MYNFTFANVGGSTRVKIQSGDDIRHLGELDQKMWTVLSCPCHGLEIDERSLNLMDADGDGQLHVTEVIKAAEWLSKVLNNLDTLYLATDRVDKDNILDPDLRAIADKLPEATLKALDEMLTTITVEEEKAPEAPYPANVIAAYKAKKEEYAAYFEQEKLQQIGLTVIPEETPKPGMKEAEFLEMGTKIAEWEAAVEGVNQRNTAAWDAKRGEYEPLRKLLLLHRDFVTLLHNFVTFEQFYRVNADAIFQAGTLVIDQRACHLTLIAKELPKLDAQAPASNMFLVFCDCKNKKLNKTLQIVAAVTMGEVNSLYVGKNAIFYDRHGNDYDATITKIIDNPISIRQAFWTPYRKLAKWVEELLNKRAAEKDAKAFEDMKTKTDTALTAKTEEPIITKQQVFDIAKFAGIFAAIGMALGMIGSALASIAAGMASLLWWQIIIVFVVILLVISGPSMIMAWLKLRKRNLSPVLNANGWAVNADNLISIPFGATLTEQVSFPLVKLNDPFAKSGMEPWKKWAIAIVCILAAIAIAVLVLRTTGVFGGEEATCVQASQCLTDSLQNQ